MANKIPLVVSAGGSIQQLQPDDDLTDASGNPFGTSGDGGMTIGAAVTGGTANDVLVINADGNLAQIAPGASGNVLVSDGTVWTSNPVSFDGGLF